ncbi:restriction endonuclease subunit S [Helicobacter pylori]|nr:restriction endonuclease subunit S [Helicobacter pylori]
MDALTTPLPKDWEVKTFRDISTINQGLQIPISQRLKAPTEHAKFYITIQALNNRKEFEYIKTYNESVVCHKDDILMTRTGNTGMVITNIEGVFHNNFFKINFDRTLINKDFLVYFLSLEQTQKTILKKAGTSTIPDLNHNDFYSLSIPLPPLNEQIAIANILSGLDRYLCALDALILKKEGVKKALSFELLSQRKRLKGFNQAWQRVKVKDFGIIITGSTPLTQISEYWNGTISWITPTDINDNKDIFNSERKITQKGLDTIRMIPKNSVLVTCIASIGKNAILRVNGACNQQINAIIPNKDFNADFIYYLMENNKQYLLGKAGVTATYIISKQVFEEIDFFVPKDLNEQIAIANILSALDHEIISLKNKKRQFENIKKALNHDLMSAKIRVLNK